MLRTSESETEILLGNKQLLGIFFVVVILLGVAFAGGYKLGQASKKAVGAPLVTDQAAASDAAGTGGETHSVAAASAPSETSPETTQQTQAPALQGPPSGEDEPPLGSSKHAKAAKSHEPESIAPAPSTTSGFTPQAGQMFLQVTAVGRDEAEAIADVLHKKGFRAHAVPNPRNTKLYRVLVGPIRDTVDLSSTRDSLRKVGFREVFVQRYENR